MLPHEMGADMGEKAAALGILVVRRDEGVSDGEETTSQSKFAPDEKSEILRSIRKTMVTDRPYGTVL